MRRIFADTSYWMGLVNPRDQIHQKAVGVSRELSAESLVTTDMVLAEVLNSFSDSLYREAVGRMVASLRQDPSLTIVPQTRDQFESALQRYRQAADKGWSLTDCASFQVMEAEQIRSALTHDQHFAQAGFDTLLR
jgi:predicted nucleic acid-binding protein